MTNHATIGAGQQPNPKSRRDGVNIASWPRLSVLKALPADTEHGPFSTSVCVLKGSHQPAIEGAREYAEPTWQARVFTGLTLIALGGLFALDALGHLWARELVRAAWPLFLLVVGFSIVVIVTERGDIVGRIGIITGAVILAAARFGILPEAMLSTIGPGAFMLTGIALVLSGVGLYVRSPRQDDARRPVGPVARGLGAARPYLRGW